MPRDLTGTWIVVRLSPPENVDLGYVAIALSDAFRKDMRRLIKAGKAAAEVYGSTSLTLKTWSGHSCWLNGAPENHDYFEELDFCEWTEMRLPPMAALTLSDEEARAELDKAVASVTARTECEQAALTLHDYNTDLHLAFTAYEKHSDIKTACEGLPRYVLDWIMNDEVSDE